MKKQNLKNANRVRKAVPSLKKLDNIVLCAAVANYSTNTVIEIAKKAEEHLGEYEGLSVNNSKTKRASFVGIVGQELAEKVYARPAGVGAIYQMVFYIQSKKFGLGETMAEQRAERRMEANIRWLDVTEDEDEGIVIEDSEFGRACSILGYDPNNLTEAEEEEVLRWMGYIN